MMIFKWEFRLFICLIRKKKQQEEKKQAHKKTLI